MLRDRVAQYVDTLVSGLFTRWGMLFRIYQEETWNNDAQDRDAFDMIRHLNMEIDDLEDNTQPLLKEALA